MDRHDIIEILRVGLKAISPYNAQPWQFQFKDGRLLIFAKHKDIGFWKFKNLVYYTLGAFLEDLSQGARHWRYEMSYSLGAPNYGQSEPVCVVTFKKDLQAPSHDITPVLTRYTNRNTYRPQAVPAAIIEDMRSLFAGPSREIIEVTGNKDFIESCSELERVRVTNKELRDEMAEMMRVTTREAALHPQGLDILTLGVPLHARMFIRFQKNPVFRNTIGQSLIPQNLVQTQNTKLLMHSPLLIVFKDEVASHEAIVRDWMDIQKILNRLNSHGLSSHIVASGVDITKIDRSFFSPQELALMDRAQAKIKKSLGVPSHFILSILRVGYAEEYKVKSIRVDPEALLLP